MEKNIISNLMLKEKIDKVINNKKNIKAVAIILFIVIAFFVFVINGDENEIEINDDNAISIADERTDVTNQYGNIQNKTDIYIDVAGAVKKPGVVIIPEGSRVFQAIDAAGGLLLNSETVNINLAAELMDGDKIYIPYIGEEYTNTVNNSQNDGKININSADLVTLTQLSGIGVSTAEKIITYREKNGKFKKIDDLTKVSGIGEKTLENIKDDICI